MSFIVKQGSFTLNTIKQPIQLIQYDPDHYSSQLFSTHDIQQPAQLSQWVTKRQAQFLAGRIAAKNALQAMLFTGKNNEKPQNIAIGKHREPLWPANIVGSISHNGNISVATTADIQQNTRGIGLDIQRIFSDEETMKNSHLILSQSDQALFQKGVDSFSENQLAALIFSAKESFFKAIFNQVGEYFDFDAVSVIAINGQAGELTLVSHTALGSVIKPGNSFNINFELFTCQQQEHIVAMMHYAA